MLWKKTKSHHYPSTSGGKTHIFILEGDLMRRISLGIVDSGIMLLGGDGPEKNMDYGLAMYGLKNLCEVALTARLQWQWLLYRQRSRTKMKSAK